MPAAHGAGRRQRVAWVDDDPGVRRFVGMALEDLAVELHLLADAADARTLLRQQPVDLLVTDLMLPGESGLSLLESLRDTVPAAHAVPRVVVFSARADLPGFAELQRWGVWRVLSKPAPLQVLLACVADALAATPAAQQPGPQAWHPQPDRAAVVAELFGGQEALFEAYLASCREQLPLDLAAGDTALARGDLAALLRLTHNIKGVLGGLGYPAGKQLAATLEDALLLAVQAPAEVSPRLQPAALASAWAQVSAAVLAGPLADPLTDRPERTPGS
jgi:DNA-binding response OmpR family regulator